MPLAYDSASALALPGRVLLDGDQRRRAAAFDEQLANAMARRLRRDHRHVDVLRRLHGAEADVEPVREHQHLALGHVRLDLRIHRRRRRVGHENHDDVGPLRRFGGRGDRQAVRLGLALRLAVRREAHFHLHAAVLQVQRVRVPLRSVADDGHLLRANQPEIRVVVVVHLRCH